ncbi:MAG: 30S ribosomal protein S17 [Dehalococcoidia bacterium]
MTQERPVNRKSRVGTVVSDKNDKTVVVEIQRATRHRIYRKVVRLTKKYHVHDEGNVATVGDLVRIEECRPISRLKRWELKEVLTERAVADVAPESLDQSLVEEMQRSAAHAQTEEAAGADDAAAATEPAVGDAEEEQAGS